MLALAGFSASRAGETPPRPGPGDRRPGSPEASSPAAIAAAPLHPAAVIYQPAVQGMINQVSSAQLYNLVSGLSGETPLTIGGASVTLVTRSSRSAYYIGKATQYAYEYFQALGLPVTYQDYSAAGMSLRNVIAEQAGQNGGCIYMLTAHIDDTSPTGTTYAPGADDNASGAAGVLAAAGILKNYRFTCTLRYALFTGEEQGLYGSDFYASEAKARGDPILGVLNLDMIAFNTPGSEETIEIDVRPESEGTADRVISDEISGVLQAYSIPITPYLYETNEGGSDQDSFWAVDYPAVLAIEDWENDRTPNYHSTNDRLSTLNLPFFTDFVRLAVGTTAHLAQWVPTAAGHKSYLPLTARY
jgi:Zn-dependent M28 family amino/carboxypeptidase